MNSLKTKIFHNIKKAETPPSGGALFVATSPVGASVRLAGHLRRPAVMAL